MSKNYKVKANESLGKIARDNGFSSTDPIIHANLEKWPYLAQHQSILMEGMSIIIPDKKKKQIEQSSGTEVTYNTKKPVQEYFSLKIEDHLGEIVSVKNDVQLLINGNAVPIEDLTNYDLKPVKFKVIRSANPLPDGDLSNSSLKIKFTSPLNGQSIQRQIKLEIGGLDPFIDPQANTYSGVASDNASLRKAAQKMLLNLGLYLGDLDGDLAKPDSVTAIGRFQERFMKLSCSDRDYGKATAATCIALSATQGDSLGPTQPIKYD